MVREKDVKGRRTQTNHGLVGAKDDRMRIHDMPHDVSVGGSQRTELPFVQHTTQPSIAADDREAVVGIRVH